MAETTYVILKQQGETAEEEKGGGWHQIGVHTVPGRTRAGGVAAAFMNLEGNGEKFGEGSYRAVEKSSWGEPVAIQKKISFG